MYHAKNRGNESNPLSNTIKDTSTIMCSPPYIKGEGNPSPKVLGKYYYFFLQPTGVRMATPEPLPQRATRHSRRLRGQQPLLLPSPVGSVATPPFGGPTFSLPTFYVGRVTHDCASILDSIAI